MKQKAINISQWWYNPQT